MEITLVGILVKTVNQRVDRSSLVISQAHGWQQCERDHNGFKHVSRA
jgi:hypothetical protein